jgi:hypothetical protein
VGLFSVDVTRVIERLRFVRHHEVELSSDELATIVELCQELIRVFGVQDPGTKSPERAPLSQED